MNCTPSALARAAACFCFPSGMAGRVATYLACQWASVETIGCGTPSEVILLSGSGMPEANQIYEQNAPTQWVGLTDPTWTIELIAGVWKVLSLFDPDQYETLEGDFPCIWTLLPGGTGPPPTGEYLSTDIVLDNGAGGFCRLVIDTGGNIGAYPDPGPATPDVVLSDGVGFWKLIADAGCNRGTESVAGPATIPAVLQDSGSTIWILLVAPDGSLGATS